MPDRRILSINKAKVQAMRRIRIARWFNLTLAYDVRKLYPPEYLIPGTKPSMPGPWRVYRGFE